MSDRQNGPEAPAPGTIFFSRTYDEALDLIKEARSYLAGPGRAAVQSLSSEASFDYAAESLRLTTRLTESMSWLMFQRALQEGEITAEEAQAEECHLQHFNICLPEAEARNSNALPDGLLSLMERSELLYQRIARLDRQGMEAFKRSQALAGNSESPA